MREHPSHLLYYNAPVAAVVALSAGAAHAQGDAGTANALIRDLKNPDFDTAYGATEELRKYPQYRAQVVAGLIDAITTGNWNRCEGDMREAIAGGLRRSRRDGRPRGF